MNSFTKILFFFYRWGIHNLPKASVSNIPQRSHVWCRASISRNLNCFHHSFPIWIFPHTVTNRKFRSLFHQNLIRTLVLFDNDVCDLNFGPFAFYLPISFSAARTKIKSEFLLEAMCKVDLYSLSVAREEGFLQFDFYEHFKELKSGRFYLRKLLKVAGVMRLRSWPRVSLMGGTTRPHCKHVARQMFNV